MRASSAVSIMHAKLDPKTLRSKNCPTVTVLYINNNNNILSSSLIHNGERMPSMR